MENIKYFDRVKNEWMHISLKEKIAKKGKVAEMKNEYDNRYTVRFHDLELNEEFEAMYEQFKPVFKARNPFFIECIKRGIRDLKREYLGENKERFEVLLDKLQANINNFNEIAKFIFEKLGELEAQATGLLKLSNSTQTILLKMQEGTAIDKQLLDLGLYDITCKRIEDAIEEVLKNFKL